MDPWQKKDGIKKRRKSRDNLDDEIEEKRLRSQKELYVDYDKLAEVYIDGHTGGKGKAIEVEDPDKFWELIDPDFEADAFDDNYIGHLSYKKVKTHQYRYHPRDRINKTEIDWWKADISFLPIFKSQVKDN